MRLIRENWPASDEFVRDWSELNQSAAGATVFTQWEWIRASIESYPQIGGDIVPFRFVGEGGELLGMGILMWNDYPKFPVRRRGLRSIDNNVRRIPPVLMKNPEQLIPALALLAFEFEWEVDYIDLFKLEGLDGQLAEAQQSLRERGVRCQLEIFNEQPRIHFAESWEDFYRSRKSTTWKNLRRMRRKISDEIGEVRFVRLRSPEELEEKLDDDLWDSIREVHRNSWQYDNGKVDPDQHFEFYRSVVEALSPKGLVDINLLYARDRLLAFDINLRHGKSVFSMFGAYDRQCRKWGPGTVLLAEWVEDSHKRGDRFLEFGGDRLNYMGNWAQEYEASYHLRIRGKRLWGRLSALRDRPLAADFRGATLARIKGKLKRMGVPAWMFDYSRFYVFRMPCLKEPGSPVGVSWRRLSRDDIPAMCECRGMADFIKGGQVYASRMDAGSVAVGIFVAGRLEGYMFGHMGANILEDEDRYRMNLGHDGAYLYDSWIRPGARGRGYYAWIIHGLQRHMATEQGARYFALTVDSANGRSLKAHAKLGAQCVERVTYQAFLGLCRHGWKNRHGRCSIVDRYGTQMDFMSRLFPLG